VAEDDEVAELLAQAKAAAQGRELWRRSGPVWRRLLDLRVPLKTIKEETGVSPATVGRVARVARSVRSSTSRKPGSTDPT
jgi:hypothetical protein